MPEPQSLSEWQNLGNNSPKTFLQVLAMEKMVGMAGAIRSHLMAERNTLKFNDGTLGKATKTPQDKALEDMNLSVGDTIIVQAPEQADADVPTVTPTVVPDVPATQPTPSGAGCSTCPARPGPTTTRRWSRPAAGCTRARSRRSR